MQYQTMHIFICYDIIDIRLKVALNTIILTSIFLCSFFIPFYDIIISIIEH